MSLPRPETILRQWERLQKGDLGMTHEKHAAILSIPIEVYKARLTHAIKMREQQPYFSLGQPLKLSGDWIIIGDVHVPFTDLDWLDLMLQVAKKHLQYPKLLIAGDLLNMDVFSKYPHLTSTPTWQQERDMARAMFDAFWDTFQEVAIIMGNHERRAQRFTSGAFDEVDIFSLLTTNAKLVSSNYGWCTIDTPTGEWRVTHPTNYSVNQLNVLDTLANKFCQNVIGCHEHHLSIGWDRFGRHVIVNGGCLVDPEKLAYVSLDDSRSAGMKQGFVMLRAGVPYIFGKSPITDWAKWL